MTDEMRLLASDDAKAAWDLGALTFGYHHQEMPAAPPEPPPGRRTWGVFDGGRLLAKAVDLEQAHWFGGRSVPASGVAGVAVAADQRGRGLGRRVLERLLVDVHERGAVISTLFDTTPVPYRRMGWEEVGALTTLAVPTTAIEAVRPRAEVATRAAVESDVDAIRALYESVARDGAGMMDRSATPRFRQTPAEFVDEWNGTTVAVDADGVAGYVTWDRGKGYGAEAQIEVGDLYARTAEATLALVAVLGGWASVAPTVTLRDRPGDPVYTLTTARGPARVHEREPWCLRLVDAAGAVAARGWPPLTAVVDLDLVDAECPWNAGPRRLVLAGDGTAALEPGGDGAVRFTARGLAAWYAGAATPAQLRRAGLLDGDASSDPLLAAATAGPPPTLLDYF